MIDRYSRPEMADIWSDDGRLSRWLKVELAVCDVLAETGEIPSEAVRVIRDRAAFDVERINEIEKEVRHDVIAFLTNVAEFVGAESRFVHYGMTSSDVIDTAMALQIKDSGKLLLREIDRIIEILSNRAEEHRYTYMVGRTHGVHAEPTTFGLKLLVFSEEFSRHRDRLSEAITDAAVGKISGAVGTFAHLDPDVEERVCEVLGLGFEPVATQIVQRDRHAAFQCVLALVASSLEKLAVEFRHLARTEVGEVQEEFGKGQKGSSAMPHKKNPWRFENVTGLARIVRNNAGAALENQALWHERDISNSSVERVVFPDSTIALDFMLDRMSNLIETLVVNPERMAENMDTSRGLVFSGTLLLEITRKGVTREEAYGLVQSHAMETWEQGGSFQERILADERILSILEREEILKVFDLSHALRNVDAIFARVRKKRK